MIGSIAQRYHQEMRALQDQGVEFAREFPEAARFLDASGLEDRDPYVERLVESFGFLTARIREASDQQADGIRRVFQDLLQGGVEEPLPAQLVCQVVPRRTLAGKAVVPAGTMLRSGDRRRPVGWVTVLDQVVQPLVLRAAHAPFAERGNSHLEWELEWFAPSLDPDRPDRLRFFLHGDPALCWILRHALVRRLVRIQWQVSEGEWTDLPGGKVVPTAVPALVGQPSCASPLVRMRDFLCSEEGYRLLEVVGLSALPLCRLAKLRFVFDQPLPRGISRAIQADQFRLFPLLAVNRYDEAHCTFHCDHGRATYPLRPEGGCDPEVLRVLAVEGLEQGQPPRRVRYRNHLEFRHGVVDGRFFRLHAHRDETGRVSHSVSIAHTDRSVPFVDSFLSVHLQCCDGDRPHEGGLPREVRGIDLPTGVGLVPLTRPGRRLRPPPGDTLLHSLALAHFQGLFEVSRLRDVLSHLVWDPPEAKRGLVESLQQVSVSAQFGRFQGVAFPIQVVRVVLKDLGCTRDTWERIGLLEAFGEAMVVVLADQVPLGSKGRLELVVEPCGLVLDYPMPC